MIVRLGNPIALLLSCAAGAAWGQATELPVGGPDADRLAARILAVTQPYDEEVVVRGQRSIWRQLERAEDAFFERFNAINSHDDFDITCQAHARLGTTIKQRRCEPNFWRDENSNIARDTTHVLQGSGFSGSVGIYLAAQHRKSDLLLAEITALAQNDVELGDALQNLVDVRRRMESAPRESSTRVVVPPDGVPLPFDAERIVFGRVGRQDWAHALASRTFAFSDLDGDIYEMQARCDAGTMPLRYETDMEWTLPASWGACELLVEASRGTNFYLLEFD